jgi:hypothetical protein
MDKFNEIRLLRWAQGWPAEGIFDFAKFRVDSGGPSPYTSASG